MRPTDMTLLEQLRVTDLDLETRKTLYGLTDADVARLASVRGLVETRLDDVVARFYEAQTAVPEIALLIGDADTLVRLRNAQRRYLDGLFSGSYNLEYVNNRLRIGLVHKRIGVDPKLYLAAVHTLTTLLADDLLEAIPDRGEAEAVLASLRKLVMFDVALVFETYIRSLVTEIENSKQRSEAYARALEEKVRARTLELEALSREDPLTGLLSVRQLRPAMHDALYRAGRRGEPVAVVYLDVDDFKLVNDTQGHQAGDAVLVAVASALRDQARPEDSCFRCGGDEFCVVLPGCTAEVATSSFVGRVRAQVADRLPGLRLSVGCVDSRAPDHLGVDELLQRADQAMYADKRGAGRTTQVPVPRQDPGREVVELPVA